jgi:hypothetical protein
MSDHDDSLASLRRSALSPVHHPVGPPIPEFFQSQDDGCHVPPVVGLEEPGGVLDDHPAGIGGVDEPLILVEESGELEVVAAALPAEAESVRGCNRGVLAGEPSNEAVDAAEICAVCVTDVLQ